MPLTGVEVPVETLEKVDPNTVLLVISDDKGSVRVVKVDHHSISVNEAFLRVTANALEGGAQLQSGCWVRMNGQLVWKDPCPY